MRRLLPQDIKTELTKLVVFADTLSYVELACHLCLLANRIAALEPVELISSRHLSRKLFLKISAFYLTLKEGRFETPFQLAKDLDELANLAWEEVRELYQSSIRIDP